MKTFFLLLVCILPAYATAQQQIASVWLRMEAVPVNRDGLHHLMDNFWHKPIGTPSLIHDILLLKSPIHYLRVAYSPDISTALFVEYRYSEPELFYVREHLSFTNAPVT